VKTLTLMLGLILPLFKTKSCLLMLEAMELFNGGEFGVGISQTTSHVCKQVCQWDISMATKQMGYTKHKSEIDALNANAAAEANGPIS